MVNDSPYRGSGQLTRQQFLFYEMRTTARLMANGLTDKEILNRIKGENLYQYPTLNTIGQVASGCIARLHAMDDENLVITLAQADSITAKQICLYAMMKQFRLVRDFMITVIGTKYRQQDFTFSRREINVFFLQLQEQDDVVASWSFETVKKLESVISRVLIENEYIDNAKSTILKPVLIAKELEEAIRISGEMIYLSAFNCLY